MQCKCPTVCTSAPIPVTQLFFSSMIYIPREYNTTWEVLDENFHSLIFWRTWDLFIIFMYFSFLWKVHWKNTSYTSVHESFLVVPDLGFEGITELKYKTSDLTPVLSPWPKNHKLNDVSILIILVEGINSKKEINQEFLRRKNSWSPEWIVSIW